MSSAGDKAERNDVLVIVAGSGKSTTIIIPVDDPEALVKAITDVLQHARPRQQPSSPPPEAGS